MKRHVLECLLVCALAAAFVAGCSDSVPPPPPGWAGGKASDRDAFAVIESATNVFDLHDMAVTHRMRQNASAMVLARIDRRIRALAARMPAVAGGMVSNELQVLAFDCRRTGPERSRLYYLVRFERRFGEPLRLTAAAETHEDLEAKLRLRKGWPPAWPQDWTAPEGGWRPGETVVFTCDAKGADVPYHIHVEVSRRTHQNAPLQLLAAGLDMGWYGVAVTNIPPPVRGQ